jgi:hypothetical protein
MTSQTFPVHHSRPYLLVFADSYTSASTPTTSKVCFNSHTQGHRGSYIQAATKKEECQLIIQIKKLMNYCQKRTRLSWSRCRVGRIQDIDPPPVSQIGPSVPRGRKIRSRPALLRTRSSAYVIQDQQLSPDFSYFDDAESDPFITSPSWLKTEF